MEIGRRMMIAAGAAALTAAPSWGRGGDPLVPTTAGRVRGLRDGGVLAFKGIRYGADTRFARFQPPQPARPWPGVVDALD